MLRQENDQIERTNLSTNPPCSVPRHRILSGFCVRRVRADKQGDCSLLLSCISPSTSLLHNNPNCLSLLNAPGSGWMLEGNLERAIGRERMGFEDAIKLLVEQRMSASSGFANADQPRKPHSNKTTQQRPECFMFQ